MKLKLIYLLFITSIYAFSQKRQSFFLTGNGDTTYCVLKLKPTDFDDVLFKKTESFEPLPDNVIGYYDAILKNWYTKNSHIRNEIHFYREIISGPVSLLSKTGNYYLTKADEFAELTGDKSLSLNEFASDLYEIKEFLKGCSNLDDREIERIYSEDRTLYGHALAKLIEKYNYCVDPSSKAKSNYKRFPVEAVVFGSIGMIQPEFNDTAGPNSSFSSNYTLTNFNSSNVVQGQVKLRGGVFRRRNVLFITTSYSFGTFRASGGNKYTTGASSNFNLDSKIEGILSELQFGLEYEFRINSKFKLYPTAGFGIFKTDIKKGESTRTYTANNSKYFQDLKNEYLKNNSEPTWYFGGGVKYSLFSKWNVFAEIILHTKSVVELSNSNIKMDYKNWDLLKIGIGFKIS